MKKLGVVCCILSCCLLFGGCGKSEKPDQSQPPVQDTSSVIEEKTPDEVLELIYEPIETMGVEEADLTILKDKFFIDPETIDDYYVRYASGRFGVADTFILKPAEEQVLQVRESLEKIKLNRAKEFENYDIHNSYQIAQGAQIFEQGGYVIMLMLPDNEAARKIIDLYIPKN